MTLPVMLPGPYLEEAVQGMSQTVAEFSHVLDEVEQVRCCCAGFRLRTVLGFSGTVLVFI